MYSSASPRSARDTFRKFEQVRSFFMQALHGSPAKPLPVRLVLFGSFKEFEACRPNEFAAAYYHQTAGRDYIVMGHGGADEFPIAVHEYVHLLSRHSGLDLPPWLNEGVAELYSTLRPIADKILVGDLIPARHRALLEERWVPLAEILAADQHSPYYNEKDKAGSLYNEGWALTHMLCFRPEYREQFGRLLSGISGSKDSAAVLTRLYGRSVAQIEKDLQAYLRGSTFQGFLISAKLDKQSGEIPVEALTEFDTGLMLNDLAYRPGKEAVRQAALEKLVEQDPKRPEPYRNLGYLAWQAGRTEEAVAQFGKAFDRGDRDPTLLWDYGRLLEREHGEEAIRVLSEALSQGGERMDIRLELAEAQLRGEHAAAALETLKPIRNIPPADASRYFKIAVYAHLRNGDFKSAEVVARHFKEVAKTDEDRTAADLLIDQASVRTRTPENGPVEFEPGGRPTLRRAEVQAELKQRPSEARPERASATGRFLELDCRGEQARMVIETEAGRKVFLIEDAGKVAITSGSNGPVDMACGPQKRPARIEIGFDQPRADQAGIDGVVRTLAF